ncbi:MAG: hypothetical protein QOH61_30 [Chloroflexota bacterium]|jgi:hypothetical protein|nr:hypothetical protein [Chloroflexota bacterium]
MSEQRRAERVSTRPLVDKLGIAPGARVAIVGVPDRELRRMLMERMADFTEGDPAPATDLIFLAAESTADLERLPALRASLKPDGAIWVVSRKGKAATLRDVEVIHAAIANGLVDNKVVSFSDTHTSLRLVIPRALRAAHAAATATSPVEG